MLEADDVRHDCVVEAAVVALRDGDGDAFVLIVHLDEDFGRLEVLDLLLHQLLPWLLRQLRHRLLAALRRLLPLPALLRGRAAPLLLPPLRTALGLSQALRRRASSLAVHELII